VSERDDNVRDVARKLRELDDLAVKDGRSTHYLTLEMSAANDEYRISGNAEGLIHIARAIFDLVDRGTPGAHQHFDMTGIADKCDVPLVVTLRGGDWQ
jgi:hypothetical protein